MRHERGWPQRELIAAIGAASLRASGIRETITPNLLAGIEERKRVGSELLRPLLKPELNAEVALEILSLALARVADPKFADRMGTSRSEAIQTAVSVWASGAIAQENRTGSQPRSLKAVGR